MAGYELEFAIEARSLDQPEKWLQFVRDTGQPLNLGVTYRLTTVVEGEVEVYVAIDGTLSNLLLLEHELIRKIATYLMEVQDAHLIASYVILPFLELNKKRLQRLANNIVNLSEVSEIPDFQAKASNLSFSTEESKITVAKKTSSYMGGAIQLVTWALNYWRNGYLSNENTVVACDQALEEWLKEQLGLPLSSKDSFSHILDSALKKTVISKMQAYRIRRFHRTRNRVRNIDERVRSDTVLSMLDFCTCLMVERL